MNHALDTATITEAERCYRDEQTSAALAEAESGQFVSLEIAREELKAQIEAIHCWTCANPRSCETPNTGDPSGRTPKA